VSHVEVRFATLAVPDPEVEAGAAILSPAERARASRFLHAIDRRRFIVAHAKLRSALAARIGTAPAAIELGYGTHGKPHLRDRGRIEFNMSRAGELMALAVSSAPVGIDVVESASGERLLDAAPEFCSADELTATAVLSRSERIDALLRIWARKEALFKATGDGLSRGLSSVTLWAEPASSRIRIAGASWSVVDIPAPAGYRAALAQRVT
jgi:4'-phosphopantetheinyl transferase